MKPRKAKTGKRIVVGWQRRTEVEREGRSGCRARRAGKPKTIDVVVQVLGKRQMAFPDLLAKIQKDRLVTTKSQNFANVLGRTPRGDDQ